MKFKLLGIIITNDFKWNDHAEFIYKKACQRLYHLRQLKRAKLSNSDLIQVYQSLVRSVVEYACPVWHPGLTVDQAKLLETIQSRALKIIFPEDRYDDALQKSHLQTLENRREELCQSFLKKISNPSDKLNYLLQVRNQRNLRTKSHSQYFIPKFKTERFRKTFLPYVLSNS